LRRQRKLATHQTELGSFDTSPTLFYHAKQESRRSQQSRKMLSIPHLIVIFVVALVVFGPEKLPELARNFGKVMAEFRRATGDLRSTFEGHMRDLEREAEVRRTPGAAPTNAATPSTPTAPAGPQPVPSAPARAVPSQPSDPPVSEANAAAVQAGVVDPMQDPYLTGFDFEVPQPPESRPESAGSSTTEKAPEAAEKSPEKVSPK
jgi:TatA/E family protein of Tat protein translocase